MLVMVRPDIPLESFKLVRTESPVTSQTLVASMVMATRSPFNGILHAV
jgi:hypothetical protein